jgi:hypothetical protein
MGVDGRQVKICPRSERAVAARFGKVSLTDLRQVIATLGRIDELHLTETEFEQDGKRFILRSAPRPAASLALRAAGVALPPTVRLVD